MRLQTGRNGVLLHDRWHIPRRHLDDGGHPDVWVASAFRRSKRSNQLVKGKVEDLRSLRHAYLRYGFNLTCVHAVQAKLAYAAG